MSKKRPFQEDFLHYIWRLKKLNVNDLHTTEGEKIHIQHSGTLNNDAGPDFLDARLQIGTTKWAGNVEMHLYSSEWTTHQHQLNTAYDSVILHVVYEEDTPIFRQNGTRIPCLELKGKFDERLITTYRKLLNNEHPIPCTAHWGAVSDFTKKMWLERLLIERLERKSNAIVARLKAENNDWETVFYQFLAANFGTKVNAQPFAQLARNLPQQILAKHGDSLFQLEALLFGQAGFLEGELADDYPRKLQQEFRFLRQKYALMPLEISQWKFLRLRPANFPTIRLAQFAALTFRSSRLLSHILDTQTITGIYELFDLQMSDYWQTHYVFDKPSKNIRKKLGKSTIHLLLINTLVPFLFIYGKMRDDDAATQKAIAWLEALPSEDNRIIRTWATLDMAAQSAYQSQALLQLHNEYCNPKKCLQCAIGHAILK